MIATAERRQLPGSENTFLCIGSAGVIALEYPTTGRDPSEYL